MDPDEAEAAALTQECLAIATGAAKHPGPEAAVRSRLARMVVALDLGAEEAAMHLRAARAAGVLGLHQTGGAS